MKPQPLTIQSEVFSDLRKKFDLALLTALRKMKSLKIHEGQIRAVIGVVMDEFKDENGETVIMPEFKAQVDINLPIKGKLDVDKQAGLLMIPDRDGEGFIIASTQYSLLDMLEEQGHADD